MQNTKKEWYFLLTVSLIGVFIFYKIVLSGTSGNVHITLTQQKGSIKNIDTPRKKQKQERFFLKDINFPNDTVLRHSQFGKIDYRSNFFLDADTVLEVLQKGRYTFYIKSDDGFRLTLDKKVICQFPNNRAMKISTCTAQLQEKKYHFHLSYFQGGGPLGLQAYYRHNSDEKRYLIGDNSSYIIFKAPKQ
jgi:hypothetical protein